MAIQVYRDIAAANGAQAVAQLVFRLTQLSNGFTFLAYGTGTGGARATTFPGTPASATALAEALDDAPNSWVAWRRGTRVWSLQRSGAFANPDLSSWRFEYAAAGSVTTGDGTTPDRVTTTSTSGSQSVGNSVSFPRQVAPGSGTGATFVPDAMKCHILVDDATASFALITRRTPLPSGNFGFYCALFSDQLTSPIWPVNPDPIALGIVGSGSNSSDANMVGSTYSNAWRGLGTPSAVWTAALLENPGGLAGSTTVDQSGQDVIITPRWAYQSGAPGLIGTSTLFSLIQPGRTPIVGLTVGSALSHAAFWTVAVLNDGSPLTA